MGAILKAAKKSKKTGASPEWIKMRKNLSFVAALRPLKSKKQYKKNQKKFYSLPEKERNKIWKIKSRRELKGKK